MLVTAALPASAAHATPLCNSAHGNSNAEPRCMARLHLRARLLGPPARRPLRALSACCVSLCLTWLAWPTCCERSAVQQRRSGLTVGNEAQSSQHCTALRLLSRPCCQPCETRQRTHTQHSEARGALGEPALDTITRRWAGHSAAVAGPLSFRASPLAHSTGFACCWSCPRCTLCNIVSPAVWRPSCASHDHSLQRQQQTPCTATTQDRGQKIGALLPVKLAHSAI